MTDKSKNKIEKFIKDKKVFELECLFPDFTGSARGKVIPAVKYLREQKFKIPEYIFFHTVTGSEPDDVDDLIDPSEGDMVLIPDDETISILPWAIDISACIIHDCFRKDGSLVEFAPRNVLKRVLNFYDKKNLVPIVAPEVEFFLTQIDKSPHNPLKPPITRFNRPEDGGSAYSLDNLNDFDPLFDTIYQYCDLQGIEIETLNHEYGNAQLEFNFRHGDALKLADQVFKFKRTCRESAIRHKMYATFMAKPMEDQPGSAMHFHHSLVDKKSGKNLFVDDKGKYSQTFYHFLGGLQKYLPTLMLFLAPNVNSYRRLVPDFTAPTDVEWGLDNRNVGLRVPIDSAENTRVENRLSGVDTNPYLAIATSLTAGLLGINEKITPKPAVQGDKYVKTANLPQSLGESIAALEVYNKAHDILGTKFVKAFKAVKKYELGEYSKVISSWERKFLLLSV